jgi:hypothetical protein
MAAQSCAMAASVAKIKMQAVTRTNVRMISPLAAPLAVNNVLQTAILFAQSELSPHLRGLRLMQKETFSLEILQARWGV